MDGAMSVALDVIEPGAMICTTLDIDGMTCSVCSGTVERALTAVPGVSNAYVNLSTNTAKVYSHQCMDNSTLCSAVEEIGFGAAISSTGSKRSSGRVLLTIPDQKAVDFLLSMDGVEEVVALDGHQVRIDYSPTLCKARTILEQLQQHGYSAEITKQFSDHHHRKAHMEARQEAESDRWLSRFWISLSLTIPVFFICMTDSLSEIKLVHDCSYRTILLAVFVTPVQFYVGSGFYIGGMNAIRAGAANMDVLVVLGTTAAYSYSMASLIFMVYSEPLGQELPTFFETSAYLITFVLLGKYLELLAKAKTSTALLKLMGLAPKVARVITLSDTGKVMTSEEVDANLVEIGELVLVLRGEKFPADGIVKHGLSTVNESLVTGESQSIVKVSGDYIIGATVNLDDQLIVETTATGSDTVLSSIISLVEEAQTSKAPIQAQADKLASVFVPSVLFVSLVTFIVWYSLLKLNIVPQSAKIPHGVDDFLFAFMFAVSVIVISCPCALGLATPTAVMVATGVAARLGILIKGGRALETAGKASIVLFDKTGTLTIGAPQVIGAHIVEDIDEDSFWTLVGSSEMQSEHLIGRCLYSFALSKCKSDLAGVEQFDMPEAFEAKTGAGISAEINGMQVLIGNNSWLTDHGSIVDQWAHDHVESASAFGHTSVLVAFDRRLVAVIVVADACKPEAESVVSYLESRGLEVWIVTGDNDETARTIADMVGISRRRVASEVRPAGKQELVARLQSEGHVVVFVGDGINDSPALARSDVGVALGAGADIAVASADIVLLSNKLTEVATALDLSQVALRRIRWNLIWALIYNIVAIPAAAGLFYPLIHEALPPALAGLAMAASSLSVVISSLFLERYKPPSMENISKDRYRRADSSEHERELLVPAVNNFLIPRRKSENII